MKGYIFEYFKYIRYREESLDKLNKDMPIKDAERAILTFGDFDRLLVNTVTDFSRFRDISDLGKRWIGNRQSILLYELDDNTKFEFKNDEENLGFWNLEKNALDEHLFYALTEFVFVYNQTNTYDDMLDKAKKEIQNVISSSEEDVDFQILGTLGTYGIAVLWFSNQFTTILKLTDKIKKKNFKKFLTAYTIFSKNPLYSNSEQQDELINSIEGEAQVQITIKNHIDVSIFENIKCEKKLHSTGEYDLFIMLKASDAYNYFENVDIFDHSLDKYQENFLQTKLILLDALDDSLKLDDNESNYEEGDNIGGKVCIEPENVIAFKQIHEKYMELRDKIKKLISKDAGVIDTLDNMLCDYRCNVAFATNERWAQDFTYIFYKNLEHMQKVFDLGVKEKYRLNALEKIRMMMNRLKQHIFHLAEANSLNLEIPKSHLRYTGQEDSIIFCYLGIVKEILEVAYQLDGNNKQSEIVPLIVVDPVPIIESELYIDILDIMKEDEADQTLKILSLNLPHVAFYNIPEYMQYMYHEIYHYIVPYDREERDYYMGSFCVMNYVQRVFLTYFKECIQQTEIEADILVKYINPIIYQFVVERYSDIHDFLICGGTGKSKADKDKVYLVSERYINNLHRYLTNSDNLKFWKDCYNYVYQCLESGCVADLTFIDIINRKLFGNEVDRKSVEKIFKDKTFDEYIKSSLLIYKSSRENYIDSIYMGCKEIYADLAMIEFSCMSLDEYLVQYSTALNYRFVDPKDFIVEKNLLDDEIKELLRLGIILDYYKRKGVRLEEIKEKFIWKYIAKHFTLVDQKNADLENNKTRIEKYRGVAENWYNVFVKCMNYENSFVILSCSQLLYYFENSVVSTRCREYNIKEKASYYFEEYRNANEIYALELSKIYEEANNCLDIEQSKYNNAREKLNKVVFRENVKLLHYFQHQGSLQNIGKINSNCNQKKENKIINNAMSVKGMSIERNAKDLRKYENYKCVYKVHSVDDFIKKLQIISKEIRENNIRRLGKGDFPIWYRGQENANYTLLPNIMRENKADKRKRYNYLSQFQRHLYEEFKYKADGAPEIINASAYGLSDYIALMQHYEVLTNFMDWSEDALTALFFTFEKLIENNQTIANNTAAIFIFCPHLYNEARKYMIQNEAEQTDCTEAAFRASIQTAERYEGWIPNIAAKHNENIYDVFLLGNLDYETKNMYGNKQIMKLNKGKEIAYLPIALYTSRLNPRLRSQSGIFLAYNLYAEPSIGNDYSYMALEKIQKYYLYECKRENKYPFLYKIEINKDAGQSFAKFLKAIGISKERMYPELSNIGRRIE